MPLPPPRSPAIQFDASRYSFQGNRNGIQVWHLPDGGGLGLYSFDKKPDIPQNAASVSELQAYYEQLAQGGMQLVECGIIRLDGVQGSRLIAKAQEPRGPSIYLGSLTIPFRDFSYVIKLQCAEEGATGIREAFLTNRG